MTDTAQQIDALLTAARSEGYEQGYEAAKRTYLLKAADSLNEVVRAAWIAHEGVLKDWARELGRTLHTAIPDRDVKPPNAV